MAKSKSEQLVELLDLSLAWKRAKADMSDRVFVRHPFELALIEQDTGSWLAHLSNVMKSGQYNPEPLIVCDSPKPRGAVRPGAHLQTNDRIVFAALLGACFTHIQGGLAWSQGSVDFSYLLADDPNHPEWLKNQFVGWKNFERKTLAALRNPVTHVLFTDITGYYENVVLETLMSDLRQLGCSELAVVKLSTVLNRWTESPGRGIPQGHAPADILGKVYLNSIDDSLRNEGFTHLRYVDDYRILCTSESHAKRALLRLTQLMRKRGLSLQSAKTEILDADDARQKIESLTQILIETRNTFIKRAIEFFESSEYMTVADIERLLNETKFDDLNETPLRVLHQAFEQHVIEEPNELNKSLFHFLLNRLGKAGDDFGAEFCFTALKKHPQETPAVLRYLTKTTAVPNWDDRIATYLLSQDAIYPYQNYQILEWRFVCETKCSDGLLSIVRDFAFDNALPAYLRSAARAILSRDGTPADLERFVEAYARASRPLEQAELICCLKPLEKHRRNTFVARFKDDSELHKRAWQHVRN